MIAPLEYTKFIDDIKALMDKATPLGLFRTRHKLHKALHEAREETFEAIPPKVVNVVFTIGPVSQRQL